MSVWHFTRGYVKIELHSSKLEKTVNALLAEGVRLHNIRRISHRKLDAVIPMRDYSQLCAVSDTFGCDVRVVEQKGFPVLLKCMKGRPVLLAVLLAGLAAMLIMSRYIWFVRINGCDRVAETAVIQALSASGVSAGALKSSLDTDALKDAVLDVSANIGFVDIRLDGAVLLVEIREASDTDFSVDYGGPSSIHADKDCVIVEISALSGMAAVKKGDAVKRGAVLIDGNVVAADGSVKKVKSEGRIVGRVLYRLTATESAQAVRLVRSGNECDYIMLKALGASVISHIPYAHYDLECGEERTLDSCGVPIIAQRGKCYELIEGDALRDRAEMVDTAMARAESKLMNAVAKDARIIMKKSELIWNDDGSVTAVITIETIEDIGYMRLI